MKTIDNRQIFDLTLTVRSPLCIGSGSRLQKNEYLYDPRTRVVSVLDPNAFVALLDRKNLIDAYEQFILQGGALFRFLREDCRLTSREIDSVVRYTLSAADALGENTPLREIQTFQRDVRGRAYLPGAGVKGALRTAYLTYRILQEERRTGEPFRESDYLNLLTFDKKRPQNMVNDLFRGVSVTDSDPLPDSAMILAGKVDILPDGSVNRIKVCRESLCPGTTVHLTLTLDQTLLEGKITRETLQESITAFADYYRKTYLPHFRLPPSALGESYQNCLLLGAGTGFWAKTVAYPYYGEKQALRQTSAFLQKKFPRGGHARDEAKGIAPHTLKYTQYNGRLTPFGVCGVEIQ